MNAARELFSRVLSKFKILFWRSISVQSYCFHVVQTVHVWSETVGSRMTTPATPENVSRVDSLIKKDPKMTYAEMQGITKISSGSE